MTARTPRFENVGRRTALQKENPPEQPLETIVARREALAKAEGAEGEPAGGPAGGESVALLRAHADSQQAMFKSLEKAAAAAAGVERGPSSSRPQIRSCRREMEEATRSRRARAGRGFGALCGGSADQPPPPAGPAGAGAPPPSSML